VNLVTADVVREAKKAPFVPFDLVLADGTKFTVTNPDFIWIAPFPRAREIIYSIPDDVAPDGYRFHTINLGLVSQVIRPSTAKAVDEQRNNGV
jgi:hypothetical protein